MESPSSSCLIWPRAVLNSVNCLIKLSAAPIVSLRIPGGLRAGLLDKQLERSTWRMLLCLATMKNGQNTSRYFLSYPACGPSRIWSYSSLATRELKTLLSRQQPPGASELSKVCWLSSKNSVLQKSRRNLCPRRCRPLPGQLLCWRKESLTQAYLTFKSKKVCCC